MFAWSFLWLISRLMLFCCERKKLYQANSMAWSLSWWYRQNNESRMRNYVVIREPQYCIIFQARLVMLRLFILGKRLAWPFEQLLTAQIVGSGGELKLELKFLWLLLSSCHLVLPVEVAETIVPISSNSKSCQIPNIGRKTCSIAQNCRWDTNFCLHICYCKMHVVSIIKSNYHFMSKSFLTTNLVIARTD